MNHSLQFHRRNTEHCGPGDFLRGRQILFHQNRRDGECARDVVEPVARCVLWEVVGRLKVHTEKVADGAVVLGPVQPPNPHAIGPGSLLLGAFDISFQPGQDWFEFVFAGLSSFLGWHGAFAEHVQNLFDGRQALGERLLVLELVESHAATLLVGVTLETVLGQKGVNRFLERLPVGRQDRLCAWPLVCRGELEASNAQKTATAAAILTPL